VIIMPIRLLLSFAILAALAGPATAAGLQGRALAEALRHGGYVLVMRHASSPALPPDAAEADPGNPGLQRQLDSRGKVSAMAMGEAIRRLQVRIGQVWSSPTFRALQTARLAGLPAPMAAPELGDRGQSMSAASGVQSVWLKIKASERPRPGTDNVLITHQPNIAAAFGPEASGLGDGEALVFEPLGQGRERLVGRIPVMDWPSLAGTDPAA
jgi:phosphohistidine phosphatase SixA